MIDKCLKLHDFLAFQIKGHKKTQISLGVIFSFTLMINDLIDS
jgi:hypothetical protein